MKSKVPIASKSRSVALVLWPARVPSSCFMGQLVPSPRCHGCSEPSSISLGHAHIQLSDNKLLSRAHALHATCPTEGVSTIQTSSSQKCGPISKTKIIFLVTLSYYLPFSLSLSGCTVESSRVMYVMTYIIALMVRDCGLVYLALKFSRFQRLSH